MAINFDKRSLSYKHTALEDGELKSHSKTYTGVSSVECTESMLSNFFRAVAEISASEISDIGYTDKYLIVDND